MENSQSGADTHPHTHEHINESNVIVTQAIAVKTSMCDLKKDQFLELQIPV